MQENSQCSTYYDLLADPWHLAVPWIGLGILALGMLQYVTPKYFYVWGDSGKYKKHILIGFIILAFYSSVSGWWDVYSKFKLASDKYKKGDFEVIKGRVDDFHPINPNERDIVESFFVDGKRFSYSPYF